MSEVGTKEHEMRERKQEISTSQPSVGEQEVLDQYTHLQRSTLCVLLGWGLFCFCGYYWGFFSRAPEAYVGAALMAATIFFYGELACSMFAKVYRGPQLIVAVLLKIALILFIVRSEFLSRPETVLWALGCFIGFLVATTLAAGVLQSRRSSN